MLNAQLPALVALDLLEGALGDDARRWKPALNAFAITFADRFPSAGTY